MPKTDLDSLQWATDLPALGTPAGTEVIFVRKTDGTLAYLPISALFGGIPVLGTATAASVSLVPSGSISSTDLQAFSTEVDAEKQPLAANLTAVGGVAVNGLLARTGSGTAAARTITQGAGVVVTNGDGVAGNPTVAANVTTVHGRTGAVVAVAGDYNSTLISHTPAGNIAANTTGAAINELDAEKQPLNSILTSVSGASGTAGFIKKSGATTVALDTASYVSNTVAPIADVSWGTSFKIINLADPVSAQDAATKAYVDTHGQGLVPKTSVKAATTANITLSGLQVIDGSYTTIAGDRILVKANTAGAQNGLYAAASGAWTRTTDADTWAELPGAYVFVENGATLKNTSWSCTNVTGGTLETTAVTWTQQSAPGTYTAGVGLTLFGTQFSLTPGVIVTPGTYKSVTIDTYGRAIDGSNPTTLAGFGITDAQPLDPDVTALANISTPGLLANTGAGTAAARSMASPDGNIVWSNANGVAGNPTSTLAATLTSNASVAIYKNGTLIGTRLGVNLQEGTGATFTITDNPGANRVDVTASAAGGGSADAITLDATSVDMAPDQWAGDTATWKSGTRPAGVGFLHDYHFLVQDMPATLPASSTAPVDVLLPLQVDPTRVALILSTGAPLNGGPTGNVADSSGGYSKVKISLPDNLHIRYDPTSLRALAPAAQMRCQVMTCMPPPGHAYEVQSLGIFSVPFTGTNESGTLDISAALTALLGAPSLTAAQRKKVTCHDLGWDSGNINRQFGWNPYIVDDGTGGGSVIKVVNEVPTASSGGNVQVELLGWWGANWKVHFAAGNNLSPAGEDTGNVALKDTPPADWVSGAWTATTGTTTSSVGSWSRASILTAGWRGKDSTGTNAQVNNNSWPIWFPGTVADGTSLANINYYFDPSHSLDTHAAIVYVLEDLNTSAASMLVTRYTVTSFGTITYYANGVATGGSGGTAYTNGDILTVPGGTHAGSAATFTAAVTGGVVQTATTVPANPGGGYSALPTNPVAVTGGTGTGASLNLVWINGARTIQPVTNVPVRRIDGALVIARGVSSVGTTTGPQNTFSVNRFTAYLTNISLDTGLPVTDVRLNLDLATGEQFSKIAVEVVSMPTAV